MEPKPSEGLFPPRLHLGAAYYPEHWPEERWPDDIRLMRAAGLTVVRMAEFAWSSLEPAEGIFHFEWLDRAIQALAESGIATVLGTPTAAPPAWLVQEYPDLMAVAENGQRVQFGNRCHYCVNSPELHAATQRIVAAMAEHFGSHPRVIGWQLDNEYYRVCYCKRCQNLFQVYLVEKYGTLDELNAHWTTRYWSQTYSAWEQIPIPIGPHNPGLMLEFKRFITLSYRKFQQLQLESLRPHLAPGVWVTHNFMGWFDGYDHYEMTQDLDMASWDWYIGTGHLDYLSTGATHDLTRGFKRQNFWLIETQPGNVNWSPVNNVLDKGEARLMAWHAVAHGADAVLYWQWRSALGGQEQYHGTLVDQSGQPRPFYEEARQLGDEFARVSALLAGSKPDARIALLNCYQSRWSIQWQAHHKDFNYVSHLTHYYRALARQNVSIDVISADAPLAGYRLVIAPALLLVDEKRAAALEEFVKRGGHLVLTIRCGMKDNYNALHPLRQPGPLAELAGVEVEEYYALDQPVPVIGNWFKGESWQWAERLKVIDEKRASVIARYGLANGWLDNQTAIAVHAYGNGLVYYVGTYLDEGAQRALLEHILRVSAVKPAISAPPGVEVCRRVNPQGTQVWILINHEKTDQRIPLPWRAHDHLLGEEIADELPLPSYGVAVLTRVE